MFKNGLYNLAGAFIRLVLGLVSVPVLVNVLGTETYGLYTIIMSVLTFATLSEWCVCLLLTVYIAKDISIYGNTDHTLQSTLLIVLILSGVTGLMLWFISPLLAQFFDSSSTSQAKVFIEGCRISCIVVVARIFQQYFIGLEQGYGDYKLMNALSTIYNVTLTISIVVCAWYYKAIIPILIVQGGLAIIGCIIHCYFCWQKKYMRYLNFSAPIDYRKFVDMLSYGFRTYIGVVGSAFFSQGDRIIIAKLLGFEVAGIYAALTSIVTQINTLSAIPVQPIVSKIISEESSVECTPTASIVSTVKNAILLNATLAVFIGSTIVLVAPEIVDILFKGGLYRDKNLSMLLRLLTIAYVIYSLNAVGYYLLFALRLEYINTLTKLLCGLVTLLLITLLALHYGLSGAIVGNFGYLLTLYLLFTGISKMNIKPLTILKNLYVPLVLFFISVIISITTDNIFLRIITGGLVCSVLIKPLLKEMFFVSRKPLSNTTIS